MIKFKTKVIKIYTPDKTSYREAIQVPEFTRKHCDMAFFRQHKRYGGFANSDMFPSMLKRIRAGFMPNKYNNLVYLDAMPEGWEVDTSGFLANVKIIVA